MKGSLQRQDVLDALTRQVTPGIKLTALADELGLRKHEVAGLRALLLALVEEGRLHVLPGGAFAFAPLGRGGDPHGKPPVPSRLELARQQRADERERAMQKAASKSDAKTNEKTNEKSHDKMSDRASDKKTGKTKAGKDERKAVGLRAEPRKPVKLTPRSAALSPKAKSQGAGAGQDDGWSVPDMTPEPVNAKAKPAVSQLDDEYARQLGDLPEGERAAEPEAPRRPRAARLQERPSSRNHAERGERGARGALASGRGGGAPTAGMRSAPDAAPLPAPRPPASPARPPVPAGVVGRITIHPAGYGFVATDDGQTVFVPAKYRGLSLDGDQVSLTTWAGVKGIEGRVDSVLARGRARLTGILRRAGSMRMYLEPDDPRIAADYGRVALEGVDLGKEGQAVVCEITQYPTPLSPAMAGRVLKVLGDPEDPRTEIEKILAVASIPLEFPEATMAQAVATPQQLGPADFADRIDLRSRRFCTIDPETARDFDDALCVEDGPHGGPRVWVAVADVAHYVRWDDALDREAKIRGVSVYLPDRVISMLPIQLSAGICSLNPDVDRCAMVVRLDFDRDGAVVEAGLAAAVIRSHARLDYPGVAAALGGDFRGRREQYRQWEGELRRLSNLAQQLRARRAQRGALELEIGEPKVVLDADDARLVRDVVRAKGDPAVKGAYSLVEEFMIAANEAVGRYFRQRGVPSVWRVHAPPKLERRETLVQLLSAYNIAADPDELANPLGMRKVLDELAVHPAGRALSFLVLRTLTQAVWDTVPIGHFGLASGDYLHFTSPIRRYPDLLVHRLLKHYLHREGQASGGGYHSAPPTPDELAQLASASSMHERRAMEAEREAVSMYRAYLMREQVGERYQGVISAVTSFGAFVEIEEPFVEGLIRLDNLTSEPFVFDEIHLRLTGRLTGTVLGLGDTVTVEIASVSVLRRRIDLALVATAAGEVKLPPPGARPRFGKPHPASDKARRDRGDRRDRYAGAASSDDKPGASPWSAGKPGAGPGLSAQRRAGHAVTQAVTSGKGARPLRFGVSHRGAARLEEEDGARARKGKLKGKPAPGKGHRKGGASGKPGKPAKPGKSAKGGKAKRR